MLPESRAVLRYDTFVGEQPPPAPPRSIAPTRAAAEEVHGRVVHEVPDDPAHHAVHALIDLRRLDDLLLHRARGAPDDRVPGALLPVRTEDEASVVRPQGRREHARSPRPMHGGRLQGCAEEVVLLVPVDELVDLPM